MYVFFSVQDYESLFSGPYKPYIRNSVLLSWGREIAWPSVSGCCWCSMCFFNKYQSKGGILQLLWDPALVITFTLSMGIIARHLVGGFMHKNSPAYGKNSNLLTLGELLNLYVFPLPGFVSTVYAWCSVLRAGTFSRGWYLTQLVNYCSNESSVFILLWNSYFCLLSALGCYLRDIHFFSFLSQ